MEQPVTPATTKGVVIGLILVAISIGVYLASIDVNGPAKWIGNAAFIIGIIWAVNNYGKQINYHSTFGNYFAHGFKVTAVVTVIMILFLVVFVMVFPEFKEKAMEQGRMQMHQKNMTDEQINQAMEMTRKFFMVFVIGGSLVVYLIFGSLASLVGAAITKKEPNRFPGDSNQTMA